MITRLPPVFANNILARLGILVVIGLIIALFFIPGTIVSSLAAKSLYHFGPAIIVGGVAGWLTYSVGVWWKTTLVVALVTSALKLGSIYLLP